MTNIEKSGFAKLYPGSFLFLVLIHAGFNILLLQFPLTGILDFESSSLNGIAISFLCLLIANSEIKKNNSNFELAKIFQKSFLLFLIPIIIFAFASIFKESCSFFEGLKFYFLINLPAVFIGIAISFFGNSISKNKSLLISIFIFLVLLILPFYELYKNPQVYFYGSILSYFPGTIYDELIEIDSRILYHRMLKTFFAIVVIIISSKIIKKDLGTLKYIFLYPVLLIFFAWIFFKSEIGFSESKNSLEKKLGGKIQTEYFEIIYDNSIPVNEIKLISMLHEIYLEETSKYMNVEKPGKITSFIFKDSKQKKILFGSGAADVAKPWLNQIYINYENYERTLKHEIAHIVSAEFGVTPLKIADEFNFSLIEGIASAADGFYSENSIHYFARLAYFNEFEIKIKDLFKGASFFGSASSISYVYAGSFSKYLIDEYGIDKFKNLYGNIDFIEVFNKNIDQLQQEYFKFLEYEQIINKEKAEYYFGRKPLIKKVCPRITARLLQKGFNEIEKKNYSVSLEIFKNILSKTENYSALYGTVFSLSKLKRENEAINLLNEKLNDYKETSYYFNLKFLLADFNYRTGNFIEAKNIYEILDSFELSNTFSNLIKLRLKLDSAKVLKEYLNSENQDKFKILKDLFEKTKDQNYIPQMLEIIDQNKIREKFIPGNVNFDDSEITSDYIFLKLSEQEIKNLNFEKAEKFANLSLNYNSNKNFYPYLLYNKNKINLLKIISEKFH